ncbi:hypothetical protein JVU11DRAFT_4441 [Chiua virens]|nr:hypothetical protein JVU11DRAFT_4441 [Chiua virens]
MPAQCLIQPNPPGDPSQLPDSVLECCAHRITPNISPVELASVRKFTRAANYIAAGRSTISVLF